MKLQHFKMATFLYYTRSRSHSHRSYCYGHPKGQGLYQRLSSINNVYLSIILQSLLLQSIVMLFFKELPHKQSVHSWSGDKASYVTATCVQSPQDSVVGQPCYSSEIWTVAILLEYHHVSENNVEFIQKKWQIVLQNMYHLKCHQNM